MNLEEIYSRIPKIACQKKCQESCGPIMMSRVEWDRIKLWVGERKGTTWTCPYLNKAGLCDAYQFRPAICRIWGVIKRLRCPWGCVPERWLSNAEARDILQDLADLPPGALSSVSDYKWR